MRVRKYMVFIAGMFVAVLTMLGFSYFSNKSTSAEPELPSTNNVSTTAPTVTPFAIVDESTDTSDTFVEPDTESLDTEAILQRVLDAESRIEVLEEELAEIRLQQQLPDENPTEQEQVELLSSVFEPAIVAEIQTIRDDNQLRRLELRDRAIREGWINTDRFREESRALRNASQLRETLGDDSYDQLLFAEGRNNRVQIEAVIDNSAAHLSGIEVGDVIVRYADARIFQFRDLQDGTTSGERNESVTIQVSRNGELIDLVIPRGPMGVTLTGVTEQPLP